MKYLISILLFSGLIGNADAQNFYNSSAPKINSSAEGFALDGYDVVSYFTGEAPKKGKVEFKLVHDGAIFLFESQQNLDSFQSNPSKYLPQFGGWCAIGICFNSVDKQYPNGKYKVDPLNYSVRDEKLYLFYPENEFAAKALWSKDQVNYIEKATLVWNEIYPSGN